MAPILLGCVISNSRYRAREPVSGERDPLEPSPNGGAFIRDGPRLREGWNLERRDDACMDSNSALTSHGTPLQIELR